MSFTVRSHPLSVLSLALGALFHGPVRADTALSPVVVTGTRTEKALEDSPIRTEVVTREEIRRTNARTLRDALENVPGLQLREIHGKSGYEVSLQGLTSDQVLVLIDGMPVAASTGSTVDVSQYLLGEVERIEVVKGASSAQYGSSAMGGVINIITRRVQPGVSGEAVVDAGTYGRQNASGSSSDAGSAHGQFRIEGGNEQLRARLAVDSLNSDGFGTDPSVWTRQGDAVRREQAGSRISWLPSRQGEIWLDANAYRERDEQRYLYYAPPNYVPQRKLEDIERDRFGAGASWRFENGVSTRVQGLDETYDSRSREFSNSFLQGERHSEQHIKRLNVQTDLPAWYGQLWQFGADYNSETLEQTLDDKSELDGRAHRTSHELFAQNDILAVDDWEVVLGMRWQNDSDFGSKLAPKIAVAWTLPSGEGWSGKLRTSFGQGYRVPNLKERYYLFDHSSLGYVVIGNPDLKPESSNSFQFGGDFRIGQRLNLELNLFYNRVRDLIQNDLENYSVVNGIAQYTYENIARARTRGVESGLRWQALDSFQLNTAYTFTQTRDLDTGLELTRRPRHILRVGADWQVTDANTLTLRGRRQSSELVDSTGSGRSPAWATLDLAWRHSFGDGLSGFVGMNNVFNRQRDFSDTNDFGPITGRYTYLGLRYTFGNQP
ncbi:MAG: TonB-dependent receptor [Candidatus Dactylopiibacterium carminicum]|nr:MAG: TonB-dependent receptor [Candidatus Dactylopiibacterium carminicum]